MNQEVRVKVESMAFRGYGVVRVRGKVLFVPYAVSGDEILARIVEEKRDYSLGRLETILTPSSWRVVPPCPYFGVCGGCQWQHIDYLRQAELKIDILVETLKRVGGLQEIPPATLYPSDESYGYRVRVQMKADKGAIGYYEEGTHHLVDVDHCLIANPLVNRILSSIRQESSLFSSMDQLEINVSPGEGNGVLILYPRTPIFRMENLLKEFLQNHLTLKGIAVKAEKGQKFLLMGDPSLSLAVPFDRQGGEELRFQASPGSFFQVNLKQNQRLIEVVCRYSGSAEGELTLDLYSGIGNLTLPLSLRGKRVIGIEENGKAVEDARFNLRENRMKPTEWIRGDVAKVLTNWRRDRPELIVLDPPRAGCKPAIDPIVSLKPKKIVYVSCDPITFSRDLRLFSGRGYSLQDLSLIDMFPQTYHMEVVGLLTKN